MRRHIFAALPLCLLLLLGGCGRPEAQAANGDDQRRFIVFISIPLGCNLVSGAKWCCDDTEKSTLRRAFFHDVGQET